MRGSRDISLVPSLHSYRASTDVLITEHARVEEGEGLVSRLGRRVRGYIG